MLVLFRNVLYSNAGNKLARFLVSPIKRSIPRSFRFPINGTIKVALPDGPDVTFHVNPTCYLGKVLFWEGLEGFEPGLRRIFRHLITQSHTFLDIGANIGYYSVLAAALNPTVTVHSFEPLPAPFKYLQKNLQANGAQWVTPHRIALSNVSGPTTFFYSLNPKFPFVEDQLTSTGSLDKEQANRTSNLKEADVEQITLDAFAEQHGITGIDLIKLDTEATEHFVMDGAKQTIDNHRPIILCEVLPGRVEREIQQRMSGRGYLQFKITHEGLKEVADLTHTSSKDNDYLFCPEEKRAAVASFVLS